jgi:subfamily B ATP-binding cassette protein HlyB/CyaB
VRENIALANPGAEMSDIVAAAQLAGAHEFIMSLPKAYDTEVGEQGCTLSGGQRQRIAIARALLTRPKILIFDEATSALDYESERIIHDNMATISEGRTVFVIAHRLSAVRQCDRIVVMEEGGIVECGPHAELLALKGVYAMLYHIQHVDDSSKGAAKNTETRKPQPRRPVVRTNGGLSVSNEQGRTVISARKNLQEVPS